jgi:8-oxo-dGTP pyrophosphatase MutT (NUDIX family)
LTREIILSRLSPDWPAVDDDFAASRHLRQAAILLPLLVEDKQWKLLFIRRSNQVADHKGQVAFPGGAAEPVDNDLVCTALRETQEEIGISSENVEVLGVLEKYATITNFLITPVVGIISWPVPLFLSADEVDRAFTMPLSWLAEPSHHAEKDYVRPNGKVEKVVFFDELEGELLWGITARIVVNFLNKLKPE